VLMEIAPALAKNKFLITIVAGVPMHFYNKITQKTFPLARAMPNTPALVDAGVSCVSFNELVSNRQKEICLNLFRAIGSVHEVPEKFLDAVTALSGSGPAYVFYFLDALIDGGVFMGLPRDLSRELAIDTIIGSMKLVKETGKHPMVLKDQVTTPGGTTIEALHIMDNQNFKGVIVQAIEAATKKSKLLSKIYLE
ncbi:MAG: pyrroline-5-carboxylate reductase, partial [Promethearchaeota archaeon]